MNDLEFNPYKVEIRQGMKLPDRGWAKSLVKRMKPKSDQYVDMPDTFKCQALYAAARNIGGRVMQRKIREGVYRVWRVK